MTENSHPETQDLLRYSKNPEASEFLTLRQHLLTCADCQHQVQSMQLVKSRLTFPGISELSSLTVSDEELKQYLSDDYPESKKQALHNTIHIKPENLKALLHTALYSRSMSTNMDEDSEPALKNNAVAQIKSKASISQMISNSVKQFFSWRPPVWISVPVTACLVLVVSLQFSHESKLSPTSLVAYQDNAKIVFEDLKQPNVGIGFFSAANQRAENFTGIKITPLNKKTWKLSWQAIPDVSSYQLIISHLNDTKPAEIVNEKLKKNSFDLSLDSLTPEGHYRWQILGETKTERFVTKGGFVTSKFN